MRKKILTALLFMLTSLTAAANDTDSLQVYMLAAIQSNPAVSASYNSYKAQMEASTAGHAPFKQQADTYIVCYADVSMVWNIKIGPYGAAMAG